MGKKWLGCGCVCVLTVNVRTFVSYVNGLIDNYILFVYLCVGRWCVIVYSVWACVVCTVCCLATQISKTHIS